MTPDSRDYGVEFTLSVNLREFRDMQKELMYANNEKWLNFKKCLAGSHLIAWDNLVTKDYSDEGTRTTAEWDTAV